MTTDINHIKSLLEKYYEGMTTPEEEKTLTEYFSSATDIPEELEADRKLFAVLGDTSSYADLPADLDARIMAAVDNTTGAKEKPTRRRFSWITVTGIAAAAAAIVVFLTMIPYPTDITMETDSVTLARTQTPDTSGNQPEETSEPVVTDTEKKTEKKEEHKTVIQPSRTMRRVKNQAVAQTSATTATDSVSMLSDEELRTLRVGMKALARAQKSIAQASQCIESTDRGLREIYTTIHDKLN